jgi:hypothetical protein
MASLAHTLARALYHARRFEAVLQNVINRWRAAGGATFDSCAQSVLFEATGLLIAARSSVDEVLFIAGRRSGASPNSASKLKPSAAVSCDLMSQPSYNLDEVRVLRTHRAWYDELNSYRNALVHHGWQKQFGGYHPPDSLKPESRSPKLNIMLLPDQVSLAPDRRAHQWTYNCGARIEDLVGRAENGLRAFLQDIADLWGTKVNRGTRPEDQRETMIVALPELVFVAMDKELYVPVFSTREHALKFHESCFKSAHPMNLFEMRPTAASIDGQAASGFWFWLPGGKQFRDLLQDTGLLPQETSVVLYLDPTGRTDTTFSLGRELHRQSGQSLYDDVDGAGLHLKVSVAERDNLYVWQRVPELP